MNFRNVKVPNVPGAGVAGTLVKVALIGGTIVYAGLNSLYNVEGGQRAIVFNRIQGIKDKVVCGRISLGFLLYAIVVCG
ncbi:hypothetical protein ZIOFF_060253 [Zingiber officinale]|uniref:Prohibitin n=1 Tax=Zingiber officinale TaxID=94328 RepID=A0A8J5FGF8_ZINOF|nr:hypothetical protein ZIOFF_060253 [Zingiber officinale]